MIAWWWLAVEAVVLLGALRVVPAVLLVQAEKHRSAADLASPSASRGSFETTARPGGEKPRAASKSVREQLFGQGSPLSSMLSKPDWENDDLVGLLQEPDGGWNLPATAGNPGGVSWVEPQPVRVKISEVPKPKWLRY